MLLRRALSSASGLPRRLDGKVAIVTASTDGIGLSIARRLAADGANVMISSRKRSNVESAVKTLQSEFGDKIAGQRCHVGHAEHRQSLLDMTIQRWGGVDILVSNAAVNPYFGMTIDCPEEAWDRIFDTNVKASFLLSKLCVPEIRKRGGGNVVFVSSIAAYTPIPGLGPYSISKTALLGLTKALSSELACDSIRVNCVCPGVVKTKFSSALTETDSVAEEIMRDIPQQRFGEPSDIAGTVSFLCSEDASYITGESIVVSGGMKSRL